MNHVVTGVITRIFDGEIRGTSFESRKFWVKQVDVQYPNEYPFEMHQGNCNLLDRFEVNELVTCHIDVRGRSWSKDGKEGCMASLVCWKIYPGAQAAAAPQPQPKPQQKATPPPQPAAATAQQYFGQQTPSASDLAGDDLPF